MCRVGVLVSRKRGPSQSLVPQNGISPNYWYLPTGGTTKRVPFQPLVPQNDGPRNCSYHTMGCLPTARTKTWGHLGSIFCHFRTLSVHFRIIPFTYGLSGLFPLTSGLFPVTSLSPHSVTIYLLPYTCNCVLSEI